jgi:hypothetical protein
MTVSPGVDDQTTDNTGAGKESDVLSEREARALRQIEQQLAADAPRLAARMSRELPGKPSQWPSRLQNAAIAAVLLAAVVCLAVGAVGAGLAAALYACVLVWARRFLAGGVGPMPTRRWRMGSD